MPTLEEVIHSIRFELERAQNLWPHWPADRLHAAAIVAEEAGELIRAAVNQKNAPHLNNDQTDHEALHTAVTAIRFLIGPTSPAPKPPPNTRKHRHNATP